jgi:hypothetical protein
MTTSTITGTITTGVSLTASAFSNPLTIAAGASVSGDTAIYGPKNWTIVNHGAISGGPQGAGILLNVGGSVTNAANGAITNNKYGVESFGNGTIDNSGTIASSYSGVVVFAGVADIVNRAGGSISGVLGRFSGAGTIDNSGTITSAPVIRDILVKAGDGTYHYQLVTTNIGVDMYTNGGAITNHAGASIAGGDFGVFVGRTSENATIENAGIVTGGTDAVYLNAIGDNRLIVDAGAVFNGDVVAAAGSNTLELTSHASVGTLSGLGVKYTGFQTVTIDSGADWTIAGTMAGIGATAIDGFNSQDRLDLTDLTFNADDTPTLDNATDTLTVKTGGGMVLDTILLDGAVTGDSFKLVSDLHGGTYIEETTAVPCFCRGTMIQTPTGEVPVEQLRIGDDVTTMQGGAKPIKWIGRRAYDGRMIKDGLFILPVCLRQGSLGPNLPARDLWVSPGHAICLDGVLIPAWLLINGVSIFQVPEVETVEYFHIELDWHAVIFAAGCPTESFIDDDCRGQFHNAADFAALYPEANPAQASCLPRIEDGFQLQAIQHRLAARVGIMPAPEENGRLRGFVDVACPEMVSGWAQCETQPEVPVCLDIIAGGQRMALVLANRYRADLRDAGMGSGKHGFMFRLPAGLQGPVEVRRSSDQSALVLTEAAGALAA